MDFPVNSNDGYHRSFRNFKPPNTNKIDPFQGTADMEINNVYAANLPKNMHKLSSRPQTLEDVQPVSFKKNFLR
jgi:hypothetical protein